MNNDNESSQGVLMYHRYLLVAPKTEICQKLRQKTEIKKMITSTDRTHHTVAKQHLMLLMNATNDAPNIASRPVFNAEFNGASGGLRYPTSIAVTATT